MVKLCNLFSDYDLKIYLNRHSTEKQRALVTLFGANWATEGKFHEYLVPSGAWLSQLQLEC